MKKRNEEALETPMTPMIDVTFQLIIFFVVSAAQQKDLVDENVLLAQAKFVPAVQKTEPKTITINVRSGGEVNIALQPLTLKQLHQILKATVARTGNNIPVVLRVDGKTLYRDVDRVMEVIGRAGLYRVRICAVVTK
jgi:biopolymer transport protein ExbD